MDSTVVAASATRECTILVKYKRQRVHPSLIYTRAPTSRPTDPRCSTRYPGAAKNEISFLLYLLVLF